MSSEVGELKVKALLVLLIGDVVQYLSVGKSMSDRQIAQTVDLILEDYSIYKPDYFILCFNRAKKGEYGKQYDRIDGQVIFEWLRQFDAEYSQEIELERINEKRKQERDTVMTEAELNPEEERNKPVPMPEATKLLIQGLGRQVMPAGKKVLDSEENKYFQSLIKHFKTLCKKGEKDGLTKEMGGQTFLKIGDRWMTCNEYIQYRVLADEDGWRDHVK